MPSTVTPLIVHRSMLQNDADPFIAVSQQQPVTYKAPLSYQQSTFMRYSAHKAAKPKYQYTVEQEGKSYRCCQWCRHWCTRQCPIFDFCDRVVACPLLFYILFGLFLFLLFIALLTLFGLHPNINPAQRYYGVISTLSIVNRTTYIFGLDTLCKRTGVINNCLDITTSTAIAQIATTVILNRSMTPMKYSFSLLCTCLVVCCILRRSLVYVT